MNDRNTNPTETLEDSDSVEDEDNYDSDSENEDLFGIGSDNQNLQEISTKCHCTGAGSKRRFHRINSSSSRGENAAKKSEATAHTSSVKPADVEVSRKSKIRQKAVVDFLVSEGVPVEEVYSRLQTRYGAGVVPLTLVEFWTGQSCSKQVCSSSSNEPDAEELDPELLRSLSSRAGLQFSAARVHHLLKRGGYNEVNKVDDFTADASVYMAAVLESTTKEALKVAVDSARKFKKSRISASILLKAMQNDNELHHFFLEPKPHFEFHPVLLPSVEDTLQADG